MLSNFKILPYEDFSETYDILKDKVRSVAVLDHGYVSLIDCCPRICPIGRTPDFAIVRSARTSTTGDLKSPATDLNLLKYLMRTRHTSPFEQVSFSFLIHCPLFVSLHIIRHRTFKVNQFSGRYSVMPEEFYIPEHVRTANKQNKQQTDISYDNDLQELCDDMFKSCAKSHESYMMMIEKGIGKEMARMIISQNVYTTLNITADLHNLFHFLKLRTADDCQYETRVFADAIYALIQQIIPECCDMYENYYRDSITFSRDELIAIKNRQTTINGSKQENEEYQNKIKNL